MTTGYHPHTQERRQEGFTLTNETSLFLAYLEKCIMYAECLEKRCHKIIGQKVENTQCGFRPDRSTRPNFHSPTRADPTGAIGAIADPPNL